MKVWLRLLLAAALFSCTRPLRVGWRTSSVDRSQQRASDIGSGMSDLESSRSVHREIHVTREIWVHRLRGGQDEDTPAANEKWRGLERMYGPFCNFPQEGTAVKLDESRMTLSDEDADEEDEDVDEEEEDFVLHLPTCDALSEGGECPEHEAEAAAEDVSGFYGVAPQWSSRVPDEGVQKAEVLASRRLRRAAFDSLVIPWNITEASLDESLPAMLRQLKVIDSSITREDLSASLLKFRLCRAQVAHVKELGITHGWNVSHPPPTSVSHLSTPRPAPPGVVLQGSLE
mmetsp:Transcript_32640/g.77984  ORF Transcript_32640/g.77984 Transcript_32640/m.77984 type:complete len:287 (-) Transcript_32640:40-900(-)